MEAAHVKKPRDQGTSGRSRLRTGGKPMEKERRSTGDTEAKACKGIFMQTREKARVDYSEVDYNEVDWSGDEAIGMEVEIAVAVKDDNSNAKVGNPSEKKTGVNEKGTYDKKRKERKEKQGKEEGKRKKLKEGKRKNSASKVKKGGVKAGVCGNKEENNNEGNLEEGHTGGEILQENKSLGKRVCSQEQKKEIAERAVKIVNCANRGGKKTQTKEDNAMPDGEEADMVTEGNKEGENTQDGREEEDDERDEVDVEVGRQGGKRMKEKEKEEEPEKPEISMVLDTHPKFEETALSAGCMKIRVLEMKSRELERKKRLLELEEEANALELEAEKEKLKVTLEESIRSKASA